MALYSIHVLMIFSASELKWLQHFFLCRPRFFYDLFGTHEKNAKRWISVFFFSELKVDIRLWLWSWFWSWFWSWSWWWWRWWWWWMNEWKRKCIKLKAALYWARRRSIDQKNASIRVVFWKLVKSGKKSLPGKRKYQRSGFGVYTCEINETMEKANNLIRIFGEMKAKNLDKISAYEKTALMIWLWWQKKASWQIKKLEKGAAQLFSRCANGGGQQFTCSATPLAVTVRVCVCHSRAEHSETVCVCQLHRMPVCLMLRELRSRAKTTNIPFHTTHTIPHLNTPTTPQREARKRSDKVATKRRRKKKHTKQSLSPSRLVKQYTGEKKSSHNESQQQICQRIEISYVSAAHPVTYKIRRKHAVRCLCFHLRCFFF